MLWWKPGNIWHLQWIMASAAGLQRAQGGFSCHLLSVLLPFSLVSAWDTRAAACYGSNNGPCALPEAQQLMASPASHGRCSIASAWQVLSPTAPVSTHVLAASDLSTEFIRFVPQEGHALCTE